MATAIMDPSGFLSKEGSHGKRIVLRGRLPHPGDSVRRAGGDRSRIVHPGGPVHGRHRRGRGDDPRRAGGGGPARGQEKVFEYFRQVADGTPLPIVAQDHPASTEVHMPVPLLLRLVNEIPRVGCLKEEAPPTPAKIHALVQGMTGRKVPVLTGLGALYGIFDLERGSSGFMTGFAFPEVLVAIVREVRRGRMEAAWELYQRFLPLIVFAQQPGGGIRKEIYPMRGLIQASRVRHPGAGVSPAAAAQLRALLARILPGTDITRPLSFSATRSYRGCAVPLNS